ncbi:2og-fe oxygenase [Ceraceosorus bombacis]|uniref:2og-fe oxygenase n=1 Tax=Ceraceosorus bombacis TaxID=401625 RepID=A0A0P1BRE6_9BASI|nr:2og-fe oxygenase [Ceraceosorus bombacis]
MPFAVPVVDIGPYVQQDGTPEQRAIVAAAIDEACRTFGFIQVIGHGVPTALTNGLAEAIDEFFRLDLEVKKAYRTPPEVNRGYTAPKSESLSLSLGYESSSRMKDFFEAFNVGLAKSDFPNLPVDSKHYPENVWPSTEHAPTFKHRVQSYFVEAGRVARTEVRLDGKDDLMGMGAHTDFGIVTVLWADQVRGLQVLDAQGSWHDVSPMEGALLINLGDLTARWTNERWTSTLHRVKPPILENGTVERRRSAAYFHDGNAEALITTIPSTIAEGQAPLYDPITVGDHIAAKLGGSRAGRRNEAGRETQRVLAATG